MRAVMADVQSGKFAREWMAEHRAGAPNLQRMREAGGGGIRSKQRERRCGRLLAK
jgi:ketol-acid reductoisomerase